MFSKELGTADLGESSVSEFHGRVTVKGLNATVRVDMLRSEGGSLIRILERLKQIARDVGATSLTVEGSIANERLLGILRQRLVR